MVERGRPAGSRAMLLRAAGRYDDVRAEGECQLLGEHARSADRR